MTEFVGAARPITAFEVAALANTYAMELAGIRAVLAVESRNSGYDGRRRPIILFEPHIFYRELKALDQRRTAIQAGLAYQHWGQLPYPPSSDAQYRRLSQAILINEEAAYRSVSIGMGQILGENFKYAGCTSAKQMFEQAADSEKNQLDHMLRFIVAKGLRPALAKHDWTTFARGYNGSGQVDRYAKWLEREYGKWVEILSKPREEMTAKDLKNAGSKIIAAADSGKKAVATVAAPTIGAALDIVNNSLEPASKIIDSAKKTQGMWDWVHDNWRFFAVAGGVTVVLLACYYAWRAFKQIEDERVQNARTAINTRF